MGALVALETNEFPIPAPASVIDAAVYSHDRPPTDWSSGERCKRQCCDTFTIFKSKAAELEDDGGDRHNDYRLETRAPTCIGSPKILTILAVLAKKDMD